MLVISRAGAPRWQLVRTTSLAFACRVIDRVTARTATARSILRRPDVSTPVGHAPRDRRLLARIRQLFLLLTLFVCGLDLLQLPTADTAAGPVVTAIPSLVVGVWAVWRYRDQRGRAGPSDVVVPLMLVGQAWTFGDAGWPYAISFVALWYRSMYGGQRTVVANALLTYVGWIGAVAVTGAPTGPVDVVADILAYVGTALALHRLGMMAAEHDRLIAYERILTAISEQLLSAVTVGDVHRVAANGLLSILASGDVGPHRATVWQGDRDRLWRAHVAGDLRVELPPTVDLCALPAPQVAAYRAGEPFSTDPVTTAAVDAAVGVDGDYRTMIVVPLMLSGEPIGAVIGRSDHEPSDPSVLTLLRRFGHEISMGIDRAKLTETLRAANDELREADDLKNQFISNVSHELRTPLTAICGFGQNLHHRWDRFDDEARRDLIARIYFQAQRQRRLVDDLLLVSRMMAGTTQAFPEHVDVLDVTAQATAALPIDGIIVTGDPVAAVVDPAHLAQVVTNLVTNAAKYGVAPFHVEVAASDDAVSITVRDHGEGVPASFVPHMFERFRQASAATDARTSTGVGLGLAIVQELVHINGGTVTYEDADPGARFTVTLPLAPRPVSEALV